MNILEVNVLVLAYIGDTVYENYVRHHLVNLGINHVNKLQEECIKYVSAKNQAKILSNLLDNGIFNEDELEVIKRARNYKSTHHPKNCDIITYKHATALEALIGYLDLTLQKDRLDFIMNKIIGGE